MKPETYFMTAVLGRSAGRCLSRPHEVPRPRRVHPAGRPRTVGTALPLIPAHGPRCPQAAPDPVTPGVWRFV